MDLKFKAAFATPTENSQEEVAAEKSNSQFYYEAPERADGPAAPASPGPAPAPEPGAESPSSEEAKPSDVEEDGSPGALHGSDVFERMHRELQERRGADVYERMHRELQERWQAQEAPARPDRLPLEGPARPPRRRRPERDARLLSVPNIKYRERRAPAPAPGSLGGIMRRFSKYCVTPPHHIYIASGHVSVA